MITVRSLKLRYLGLLVYYSKRTSRHRQNGLSYVSKKILTWMLREARGVLKATVGNKVQPDYHFIHILFFQQASPHILDIVGLSQAKVSKTYFRRFPYLLF